MTSRSKLQASRHKRKDPCAGRAERLWLKMSPIASRIEIKIFPGGCSCGHVPTANRSRFSSFISLSPLETPRNPRGIHPVSRFLAPRAPVNRVSSPSQSQFWPSLLTGAFAPGWTATNAIGLSRSDRAKSIYREPRVIRSVDR